MLMLGVEYELMAKTEEFEVSVRAIMKRRGTEYIRALYSVPLLFVMALKAVSLNFHTGVPWEFLYADDLVVIADSLEECIAKLKTLKIRMYRTTCQHEED